MGPAGQPRNCPNKPSYAGYTSPPRYKVFLCGEHADEVANPVLMNAEDHAELEGRREQQRRLAGLPFERVQPTRPGRRRP